MPNLFTKKNTKKKHLQNKRIRISRISKCDLSFFLWEKVRAFWSLVLLSNELHLFSAIFIFIQLNFSNVSIYSISSTNKKLLYKNAHLVMRHDNEANVSSYNIWCGWNSMKTMNLYFSNCETIQFYLYQ